jgi:multidrug efflux pump subunit AcrA (membrane-fusion protein)
MAPSIAARQLKGSRRRFDTFKPSDQSSHMPSQLDELKELARGRVDLTTFYEHLLRQVSQTTEAEAALVWNCSQSPYQVMAEHGRSAHPHVQASMQHPRHAAMLEAAVHRQLPILIPPRTDAPDGLPVIALGPVQRDGKVELIELFLPAGGTEQDFKQWLMSLQEFCQVASRFAQGPGGEGRGVAAARPMPQAPLPRGTSAATAPARPLTAAATAHAATEARSVARSAEDIEQFVMELHRGLDATRTTARIANETRRFLDADRVSVVGYRRRKARVLAISGQPSVNRRSTTIQRLHRLLQAVLPLREVFWYPSESAHDLPAEIEQPLNQYLTASTVRSMIVVPVTDRAETGGEDPDAPNRPPALIGGLIIEKFDAGWDRAALAPQISLVARHAGSALRNAVEHQSLFLFPVWRTLGRSRIVLAARNARWSALIASLLLIVVLVLTLVPVPFRLACNGVLLPQIRRNVYAQVDGEVDQVLVDHGSPVQVGDKVIRLTNESLLRQRQEVLGQIQPLEKKLAAMDAELLERSRTAERPERPTDVEWDQDSLRASLESAQKQLEIIDSQLAMLSVESPLDGQVLSWDVRRALAGKPIRRGDLLLEVADVDGPWELELKLPDRRIGHVLRAQSKEGERLPVTFVLAADPNVSWEGTVQQIAGTTQNDPADGQTIRVDVAFDHEALDIRQVGSGVLAKIHCGYRPIGYVWLVDIVEFLQSRVFFRLW